MRNLRVAWEALNYAWDTRVLGFDADVQEAWLASLGIADLGPSSLIVEILIVVTALLVTYAGWLQFRTCPRVDRVKALYERFSCKLARQGVRRDPWEGPLDFARRAAQLLPAESDRIRQISDTYIALRYSLTPASSVIDRFATEVITFRG